MRLSDAPCCTRRRFLQAGASSVMGLTLPHVRASQSTKSDVSCIFLVLVGGPSQLDTWDPKPHAPAEFRGPLRPIATSVPGTHVSELFPQMARLAHKWSLIRSLHHTHAVVHEIGLRTIQTGRTTADGKDHPHIGCMLGSLDEGRRRRAPAHVVLPGPIRSMGGGQQSTPSAAYPGNEHDFRVAPFMRNQGLPEDFHRGSTPFAQSCRQARRLIEQGVRFVTVNMFDSVFDAPSWDTHGLRPFSDFDNLAHDVAPNFDRAFSSLIEDLGDRGLLSTTMVVAVGEFGRTPRINPHGGRDHHAGAWTAVIAGGPIQGGHVIGATDEIGFAPTRRPVTAGELAATIYRGLGVELTAAMQAHGRPIMELF